MALKKINYNNTTIYIEDEVSDEEKGYALQKENNLEKTQELNLKEELNLLEKTQEFNFNSLEDTIIMQPIGDKNE